MIIPLRVGFALIDPQDYALVSSVSKAWSETSGPRRSYAQAHQRLGFRRYTTVLMHVIIMRPPEGMVVHHVNGNGLDNRRSNLRVCSNAENLRASKNVLPVTNKSGFRGVYFDRLTNRWVAKIRAKRVIWLGRHDTAEEAAREYDKAARLIHGEFATLNFKEE